MLKKERNSVLSLLYRLINTRSDSGTIHEKQMEKLLVEEIGQMPYFANHQEYFGTSLIEGDYLGRSIVWALHDIGASKTVILLSHYDTVDLTTYGDFDGLDPELVKTQLEHSLTCRPDTEFNDEWIYGRGSCDMKAGIAINLQKLYESTNSPKGVNLLFVSVPDEETQSAGMRSATALLVSLKKRYHLTYELSILTEPHEREFPNQFTISTGSVGKIMPVIMTKGMPSHSGVAYSGLNSISIAMEIVKAIELNTEMGDSYQKKMTPPPAFLNLYSIKKSYDVTTPEFTVAYFNWLFLKGDLEVKFAQLKELCKWSLEDAINQFNYSYNEYLRKQAKPSYCECMEFNFEILFLEELKMRVKDKLDIEATYENLRKENHALADHEFTILYMQKLLEALDVNYPVVVIGLLPPFYPVVESESYYLEILKEPLENFMLSRELELIHNSYFMGISDLSYMKPSKFDPSQALNNMPVYQRSYNLNYDEIKTLDVDVLHLGPWGKDLHQKTERVYLKDIVETVPDMLEYVFQIIANK